MAEPGLVGIAPGQRRHHDPAGLRLPPRVDDRAALLADDAVVPHPGLGIDRLADRAEQAQRRQVVAARPLVAPLDEGADRRRRGVEDGDAEVVDDLPEAIGLRVVRRALVHDGGRAVRERAVDDVAVARDPADVGGAPVDVVVLQVEDAPRRERRVQEVAAGRVEDALRLPGRAARVEDEERMLAVERVRRADRRRAVHQLVPPEVASGLHRHGVADAAHHDDVACTVGVSATAASTLALSGTTAPRRQPPSAVTTRRAWASLMRSRSASAEKPPKTTLWVAPMRAQASIAIAASGIIGM